ncbi:HNH endonuclease signature motif containing protein [Schleiferilactobacillus harbinensis]|uniref:HNH endonuclease signature motif containing protein n=1 Tax=Schleiferilactobacillus harbinensis TaxID=304207 RepID=UPI0039E9C46A
MIDLDAEQINSASIVLMESSYKGLYADFEGNIYRHTKHGMKRVPTFVNNAGYQLVQVTKDNSKYTTTTVQRVVASAWLPNPEGLSDVDHKDGDKLNNAVSNLQWLSHRDNLMKSHRSYSLAGPNSPVTGRRVIKVSEDGTTKTYRSISAAAKDNYLSFSSVRGSANHQLALNKPYHFEFAQSDKQMEEK